MSVVNEHVEDLVEEARRLCLTITDGVTNGFLVDGCGTLQDQVHKVMAAARMVEAEVHAFDPVEPAEDDHLEAQVENDLGDIEPGDVSFGSDNAGW